MKISISRYIYRLIDKVWPPLKFNLNKRRTHKRTNEELDKWAEEFEKEWDKARKRRKNHGR